MVLLLSLFVLLSVGAKKSSVPVPKPSVSPSPAELSSTVTPLEAKSLLREFQNWQKVELKALKHQQDASMSELKASQNARRREWEAGESQARRKFFAEHSTGPERRAYIQDFLERRKALAKIMEDERIQRAHDNDVRFNAVKEEQQAKLKEFQDDLKAGKRPPVSLWPQPGH